MNKIHILRTVLIATLAILLTTCGGSNKKWEGSYTRYSGNDPITEHWEIILNADGSCDAVNRAEGFRNYTHYYSGTWTKWSDDIVRVDIESEPQAAHVTRSYDEIKHEASKAQNKWKRNQVYADANENQVKTTIRRYTKEFYIRDDGATAFHPDGLNNPIMMLHQN